MTLPYERKNAVINTERFLLDLLDPKKTPRVPREIRRRASSCLKHYPLAHDMDMAGKDAPKIFGEWGDWENG